MISPTRISQVIAFLGGNPDDVVLGEHNGQLTIGLGSGLALNLDGASQEVLDKLATVTAQAAADNRARTLKAVS